MPRKAKKVAPKKEANPLDKIVDALTEYEEGGPPSTTKGYDDCPSGEHDVDCCDEK